MFGRIMYDKALPYAMTLSTSVTLDQRLLAMRVQVIHNQVNFFRLGILRGNRGKHGCELRPFTVFRNAREMAPCFRFDHTKNIRRSATHILTVSPSDFSRTHRTRLPLLSQKLHGPLVQTYNRLAFSVRAL